MHLSFVSRSPEEIRRLTTEAIEAADGVIAEALATAEPDFDALFGGIDRAARLVLAAYGRGAFLASVDPDPAVRDAAGEANDAIEHWKIGVGARDDVADGITRYAQRAGLDGLDADARGYAQRWLGDIEASGRELPDAARAEIGALRGRLAELQTGFFGGLAETPRIELARADLEGVPASVLDGYPSGAEPGTLDVALNDAAADSILQNTRRRDVRERVDRLLLARGVPDNLARLDEAVEVRRRLAALLGYPSWLELRAKDLAAGSGAAIQAFIDDIEARLAPYVDADLGRMRRLLAADTGNDDVTVEDWDWRYIDTSEKAALGFDANLLREYLPFDRVFEGLQALSDEVFGARFVPRPERPGWHPDVRAFDLVDRDSGALLAWLFVDPFAREGKMGGAFEVALDPGVPGDPDRPRILALVTNAAPPQSGASLLGPLQIDMLFHEFGHALEDAFQRSRFALLIDHWVRSDWVEAPSQFLGRWGGQPGVLGRFARHVDTGAPIPSALLEAMQRLDSLNLSIKTARYLSMGLLDVLLHGAEPMSVDEANRRSWRLRGTPFVEGSAFPAFLVHLMAGYDGGIYGFVWSQILRDDILSAFEREGITSPKVGGAYRRHVLEQPWSGDPLDGLAAFLGRPWSADAFLGRLAIGGPAATDT